LLIADWSGNLPLYEALLENDFRKERFKKTNQPASLIASSTQNHKTM
jgi:hypothetical protein